MQQSTEPQRRNGYYWHEPSQQYLVSVTTFLDCLGSKEGLLQWAAQQGGLGVMAGLSRTSAESLGARLTSPEAYEWAKGQAAQGMKASQRISTNYGSALHSAVEQYLKQEVINGNWQTGTDAALVDTGLGCFRDFYESVGFGLRGVEQAVFNPDAGYAGRMDYLLELERGTEGRILPFLADNTPRPVPGVYITDLKTGQLHPKKFAFQLAAYAAACVASNAAGASDTVSTTLPADATSVGQIDAVKSRRPSLKAGGAGVPGIAGAMVFSIPKADPSKIKVLVYEKAYLDEVYTNVVLPAMQVWKFFDAPKWFKEQNNAKV